jgi:hypothetical protein
MPDRAILSLLPPLSLGFIAGVIASALIVSSGTAFAIGLAGAVLVALAAMSSVFGVRGPAGEKLTVALLRGACSVALFVATYLFLLSFFGNQMLQALVWIVLAFAFGFVISQLRVRERSEMRAQGS